MGAQTKSKPKKDIRHDIVSKYMDWVLMNEAYPKSVYKFCKEIKIDESVFYSYFGSLEVLTEYIWSAFLVQAIDLVEEANKSQEFSSRDKVLTFYFTLFEVLTVNRSYVLFVMNEGTKFSGLRQLQSMRHHFKNYMKSINHQAEDEKDQFYKLKNKAFDELQWGQFLIILKFWIDDRSAGFEKTDVMIEKLINTAFDLTDVMSVKRAIDLAKFLIKERIVKS